MYMDIPILIMLDIVRRNLGSLLAHELMSARENNCK